MKHLIPSAFRNRAVKVDLVGCGGTGSLLLTELARLDVSMRALGHPHGLFVTVFDPDVVTEANLGRQLFARGDVGAAKATLLIGRLNAFYNLVWAGFPFAYRYLDRFATPTDILITAVDSLKTRAEIYSEMRTGPFAPPAYWMDLGNAEDTGQVVIGEVEWIVDELRSAARRQPRLPNVVDIFPDMLERAADEEPEPESCTLAGALGRQSLFVNRHVASWGAELLWQMFREGGLDWHGAFINARTGRVNPLLIEGPKALQLPEIPQMSAVADTGRTRKRIVRGRELVGGAA